MTLQNWCIAQPSRQLADLASIENETLYSSPLGNDNTSVMGGKVSSRTEILFEVREERIKFLLEILDCNKKKRQAIEAGIETAAALWPRPWQYKNFREKLRRVVLYNDNAAMERRAARKYKKIAYYYIYRNLNASLLKEE